MIELKLCSPVQDKQAKIFIQACQVLFGSKRDGFEICWEDSQTIQIYQSETNVAIKRDSRKE